MKFTRWIVAACMAPAAAVAQPQAHPAGTRVTFERMQSNVARITTPGEKERWDANVAMWHSALDARGHLSSKTVDSLSARLQSIESNVAKITLADEKERWEANATLWREYLAAGGPPPASAARDAAFDRMKANVAKITVAAEKERWEANRDLWQATLAQRHR